MTLSCFRSWTWVEIKEFFNDIGVVLKFIGLDPCVHGVGTSIESEFEKKNWIKQVKVRKREEKFDRFLPKEHIGVMRPHSTERTGEARQQCARIVPQSSEAGTTRPRPAQNVIFSLSFPSSVRLILSKVF